LPQELSYLLWQKPCALLACASAPNVFSILETKQHHNKTSGKTTTIKTITTPEARVITNKTVSTVFLKKKKKTTNVCLRVNWLIRPEPIPVSVA